MRMLFWLLIHYVGSQRTFFCICGVPSVDMQSHRNTNSVRTQKTTIKLNPQLLTIKFKSLQICSAICQFLQRHFRETSWDINVHEKDATSGRDFDRCNLINLVLVNVSYTQTTGKCTTWKLDAAISADRKAWDEKKKLLCNNQYREQSTPEGSFIIVIIAILFGEKDSQQSSRQKIWQVQPNGF